MINWTYNEKARAWKHYNNRENKMEERQMKAKRKIMNSISWWDNNKSPAELMKNIEIFGKIMTPTSAFMTVVMMMTMTMMMMTGK